MIDAPPGTSCPVIASVKAADVVLLVAEPTVSGLHDPERVAHLCRQLKGKAMVCIDKASINPDVAAEIDAEAARWSMPALGTVGYDDSVTAAQVR